MAKTALVTARVDPELKRTTEGILKQLGLTHSQAITMFYRQINLRRGLPFDVHSPNEETRQAIEDALAGRNMHAVESVDALFAELSS